MTTETSTEESITTATEQICLACEGFGWSLWDGQPCESCGGTGNLRCGPGRLVPPQRSGHQHQAEHSSKPAIVTAIYSLNPAACRFL